MNLKSFHGPTLRITALESMVNAKKYIAALRDLHPLAKHSCCRFISIYSPQSLYLTLPMSHFSFYIKRPATQLELLNCLLSVQKQVDPTAASSIHRLISAESFLDSKPHFSTAQSIAVYLKLYPISH